MGSYREGTLFVGGRHSQLVLLEDSQGESDQQWPYQVQQTCPVQSEHCRLFFTHGCYDHRCHVHTELIRVSAHASSVGVKQGASINHFTSYIQFHPLAYLVKLNIEMTMANLIKRIAMSTARKTGQASIAEEFKSDSNTSASGRRTGTTRSQRRSIHELASIISYSNESKGTHERIVSFAPVGNQIKQTREVVISSEPNPYQRRGSEVEITGNFGKGLTVNERRKSMESITEGNESLRSTEVTRKDVTDSDDEAALVSKNAGFWGRRQS